MPSGFILLLLLLLLLGSILYVLLQATPQHSLEDIWLRAGLQVPVQTSK